MSVLGPPLAEPRRTQGFSVIEVLIVVAILGVLLAVGMMSFGTQGGRAYANDIRALIQQARFEAIKVNSPVAVIWSQVDQEFQTIRPLPNEADSPCDGQNVVARAGYREYRNVSVAPGFIDGEGIVWLPSGQARSCGLGAFTPTIAEVGDRTRNLTVTVSLTGRVTIE